MKQLLKISFFLLLVVSANFNLHAQQNMIFNYDFEFYSQCPDNLGQVDRCLGFFNLIEHGDYSNCNFDLTQYYSSANSGAYSGSGYMDMATHGDSFGSAEAIAQNLQGELDSGIVYQFSIMAKKSDVGLYSNNCGGICLFGFEDSIMGPNLPACTGTLPGAILLGCSDTITEIDWTLKQFNFITPSKIKAVAFSPACTPNCVQTIFIDSVSIYTVPIGIIETDDQLINVFPVPSNEKLEIDFKNNFSEKNIFIYNISGMLMRKIKVDSQKILIDVVDLPNGIYFMIVESDINLIHKKFIVQH